MTASPTPPDFFAENANKSATPPDAQVGLLSEMPGSEPGMATHAKIASVQTGLPSEEIEQTALLILQVLEAAHERIYPDEESIARLEPHVERIKARYGEIRGRSFSEAYQVSRVEFIRDAILGLIRPAFEQAELYREFAHAVFGYSAPDDDTERMMRGVIAREIAPPWPLPEVMDWMGLVPASRALSAEAKLAQAVEAREQDALELDDWAYKWLISLQPETDERKTYKDGYFYGALHVLGRVRDRARVIADVDAVSIRNDQRARAAAMGEKS